MSARWSLLAFAGHAPTILSRVHDVRCNRSEPLHRGYAVTPGRGGPESRYLQSPSPAEFYEEKERTTATRHGAGCPRYGAPAPAPHALEAARSGKASLPVLFPLNRRALDQAAAVQMSPTSSQNRSATRLVRTWRSDSDRALVKQAILRDYRFRAAVR